MLVFGRKQVSKLLNLLIRKNCHSEFYENGNVDIKNDFMALLINDIANGIQFEISYMKTRKNIHV